MLYRPSGKIYEALSKALPYAYIPLIFLITFYYFINWPIVAGDTDLWYHLNGGRYIFEYGRTPSDSFFSFISPQREWIDYYWLFQALVYLMHSFFDYYGLILFKSAMCIATGIMIFLLLFRKQQKDNHAYFAAVFSLFFLFLSSRFMLVRPYTFSYFFIVLFIYTLEFKPRHLLYLLPLLSILWFNLHGIEYPVVLLIVLSYLAEFFILNIKKREYIKKEELYFLIPLVASLAAVYATPHGYKLMSVPLISTKYVSIFISELKRTTVSDLTSFEVIKLMPTYPTIFNMLLLIACAGVIKSLWSRNIRLSHLFIFIGAVMLLAKGLRFRYEFLLLSLPVIRSYPVVSMSDFFRKRKIITSFFLVLFYAVYFHVNYKNPPRYPFSQQGLPDGVAAFLRHVKTGGSVLNHPNNGGYLQWMLYPQYKIFMDMEVPFLFTDEDLHIAGNVFSNEYIFNKVVETYHPDFISVPVANSGFKNIIKNTSDYVIVFFDDNEVLYADNKRHPELSGYKIQYLDPFDVKGREIDALLGKTDVDPFKKSVLRMIEIYPEGGITNQIMAMLCNRQKDYEKAILYEDVIIKNYPEAATGFKLKAVSLSGMNRLADSISYYKKALKKADDEGSKGIQKEMGLLYIRLKDYKNAYEALKEGTDIFAAGTTYNDLYNLASTALMLKKTRDAAFLYRLAYEKAPQDNRELQEKLKKQLELMGVEVK